MKELCTCSYVLLFRCYLDNVHQHHESGYRMMKWFQLHCWYSLLGTAHSQCRKHSRVVLPQYHGQSRHFQMEWLLWHVIADMRTLLFWCNIQLYSWYVLLKLQKSYQAQDIPTAYRPHQRLCYPKSYRRWYPINHWDKSALSLLSHHVPTGSDPLCSWLELQAQGLHEKLCL